MRSSKATLVPLRASHAIAPITSAVSTSVSAASCIKVPMASIAWVPLMSDTASFASSTSGLIWARFNAGALAMRAPFSSSFEHSPSPINASARCARGARSPLAPTLPCEGTIGVTPRLSISQMVSMMMARTPEFPFDSELARRSIMARVSAMESGSPTPTACERTRLTCNSRIWSPTMCTSLSLPTPVVIAYEILLLATSASTTARARLTASRASGSSNTGRFSAATSRTASRVRSFPLMCRAFKAVPSSQLRVVRYCLFASEFGHLCRLRRNSGFVSGHRFSDAVKSSKSDTPLGAAYGCAKHFHVFLGQRAGLHFRIGDDVRGLAFGQQLARIHFPQFVPEVDYLLPDMFQIRAHDDLVIIVYRSLIAAAGIDYGDKAIVFALHIFIGKAELAEEFHSPHFKPDEMIGVIDDAHLVGFGVADANASFIYRRSLV